MKVALLALVFIFTGVISSAAEQAPFKCGVAVGFPPYQYVNDKGDITGLDVEIAKLVFKTAGLKVTFVAHEWDHLVSNLIHHTDYIDMLVGAEFDEKRAQLMSFTTPLYLRHTNLFVLKNSHYKSTEDLYGKIVAGDEGSKFEKNLGDEKNNIRIISTASKEESFKKLKAKQVEGVIAPELVSQHFGQKLNLRLKMIGVRDQGAEVSITVRKNDKELVEKINSAVEKLKASGKIDKILKHYLKNTK